MPTCISPRMVASVLHEGPSVQMIFARRKGAVSGEHKDGEADGSVMILSTDIVRDKTQATDDAFYFPLLTFNSLPSVDRGNSMALNSAPIRMTSEIRYIHTSSAMATPSEP